MNDLCRRNGCPNSAPSRDRALAESIAPGGHNQRWEHSDMGFDGKLTEAPEALTSKAGGAPTRSVIEASLLITGNLESDGELVVDGAIVGEVCCVRLTVGKDASVKGNITAQ